MFCSVVAGEHNGKEIIVYGGVPHISTGLFSKGIPLSTATISSFEVVDNDMTKGNSDRQQRGPLKVMVSITFNDGKRSLLELTESCYKALLKSCFK